MEESQEEKLSELYSQIKGMNPNDPRFYPLFNQMISESHNIRKKEIEDEIKNLSANYTDENKKRIDDLLDELNNIT